MDKISDGENFSGIKFSILSVKQQNSLMAYDHILKRTRILFEQKNKQRMIECYEAKPDCDGLLFIGNGILDRGCLLLADVSINNIS